MTRSRPVGGLLLAIMLLSIAAGAAWACTSQPRIFALSSQQAPPGSEVRVSGQTVAPQGEVEVRWNDNEGPVLASTPADWTGSFSVAVRIPETPPGVYTILAVAGGEGVARSAIEVTRPASAPSQPDLSVPPTAGDSPWLSVPTPAGAAPGDPSSSSYALVAGVVLVGVAVAGLSFAVVAAVRRRPGTVRRG